MPSHAAFGTAKKHHQQAQVEEQVATSLAGQETAGDGTAHARILGA